MTRPPEIIEGNLIRLRRASPADATALFKAAANSDVMRYMDWIAPKTDKETRAHLEGVVESWNAGVEFQWIIEEIATGDLAGTISFRPKGHAADFGYFLAKSHWRKGIASAAGALVVGWLKEQPEILRIWATADFENTRSHRVLERLGLRREGTLQMGTYRPNIGGLPRDTAIYGWCKRDA
jgi:ribosomal-protein-alanine N-acetyltransferase